MTPPLSLRCADLRDYDARAIAGGIPGIVLMENAGRGAAEILLQAGIHQGVAIFTGKGNNAGDGFVIARHLHVQGLPVHLEMLVHPADLTGDARIAFEGARYVGVPMHLFRADACDDTNTRLRLVDWIVDALLGTGSIGPPRPPFDQAIRLINKLDQKVLAVDLPSGLDADTGHPNDPTIRATLTASFVARKLGFDDPSSEAFTGIVHVVSIGAGPP